MKNIGILHNMLPPQFCVTGPRWVNEYIPSNTLSTLMVFITAQCINAHIKMLITCSLQDVNKALNLTHFSCAQWPWLSFAWLNTSLLSTMRPRQDGLHFPHDIFKCIFYGNLQILIRILLELFPIKGAINNIPALVQIMAWWQDIVWTNDG